MKTKVIQSIEDPKPYLGKNVILEMKFIGLGDFQSYYLACDWLKQNNYGFGSSSAMNPTAIVKGDYAAAGIPQKMKNFKPADHKRINGVVVGDLRHGPVFVKIFKP